MARWRASIWNLSPSTTAAAVSPTKSAPDSRSTPLAAKATICAASSTNTNSPRRFFPYEHRPTRTSPPSQSLGYTARRGPLSLYRRHAFRLLRASPVSRLLREPSGASAPTTFAQSSKAAAMPPGGNTTGHGRRLPSRFPRRSTAGSATRISATGAATPSSSSAPACSSSISFSPTSSHDYLETEPDKLRFFCEELGVPRTALPAKAMRRPRHRTHAALLRG